MLRQTAPAKINLFLHVGARRADGFHDLESLAVFADAGDVLTFEPLDTLSLHVEGPFAAALTGELDNLVLRAARALAWAHGIEAKARIALTKNLPVASGIGGGSADAAAALRGLNALWGLGASSGMLQEIGLSLSSDVPVCVLSKPASMDGRGERVTVAAAVPPLPMVLVNPGVSVSTGEVFARLKASVTSPSSPAEERVGVRGMTSDQFVEALARRRNDLETPAIEIAPVIGEVLQELRDAGALLARMSGSGATCFGIFASAEDADNSARTIARSHPAWWCVKTNTAGA